MRANLEIGILTTDKDLKITYWNSWLEKHTELLSQYVVGKSLVELYPEIKERGLIKILNEVLEQGTVRVLSTKLHKYLIPIPYSSKYFDKMRQLVTIAPLKTQEKIVGLIITIEDVTKALEEEQELKEKLKSPDEKERIKAIRQLSQIEKGDIIESLSDESWKVRRVAIEEIKKSAEKMVIELLKKMKEEHRDLNVLNSILQILSTTNIDIIPALKEMLKDKDSDVRLYTIQLVQTLKDPKVEDLLIQALSDENPNVVFSAIEGLGKIKSQKGIPYLLEFIERDNFYLALSALEALKEIKDPSILYKIHPLIENDLLALTVIEILGEIGDETSVEILVDYLNRKNEYIEKILSSLGKIYKRYEEEYGEGEYISKIVKENIKPSGIKKLVDFLHSLPEEDLKNILLIVKDIKDPIIERAIVRLLGNPNIRNELVEVFVRYGKSIIPILIERLKEEDLEIKSFAIIALGRIGDKSVVPHIIEALNNQEELAVVCAGALAKIGDRSAFEPLINKLKDPNPYVRQAIISALNSIGHPSMPERIKKLLKSENPYERESAVKIAGYFGYEECKEEIFNLVNDKDEETRKAVYENIVFFEDEKIFGILKEGLEKEKRKVREVIARSLIYLDSEKALPLIEIALRDSSPWVRYYGVKSLVHHNPPNLLNTLQDLLSKEDTTLVKIIIIESIGKTGDIKAIDILKTLMDTNDKDLLLAVISALGNIKHPKSASQLLSFLSFPDKLIKKETLKSLGNIRDEKAVQNIVWTIANEEDPEIINEGLLALLKIGTLESLKSILTLSLDTLKRDFCINTLSNVHEDLLSKLAEDIKNKSSVLKINLILALERKKTNTIGILSKFLEDQDKAVKLQAILSLSKLGSYDSQRILKQILEKEKDLEILEIIKNALERKL